MYIYIVRPGETLGRISEMTGVSEETAAYINQISWPYGLAAGQALLLPAEAAPEAAAERERPCQKLWRPAAIKGYAYPFIDSGILRQTLPYLTSLCVFSYGFTEDGRLIPPKTDDRWMIGEAKANSVRPELTLTSLNEQDQFDNLLIHALLHDEERKERLIFALLNEMKEKGYEGLDLDFEYVQAEDRDAYTRFVARLTERMNVEGYPVSVALAPKTSDDQRGILYEGIDYAGLGAAANSVFLMTYEWGYRASPPMAVAPLPEVRRVVEYAVTRIPPEKIDLGIPNYGYDWPLFSSGEAAEARTVGNIEAAHQAVETGAEILWSDTAQSPHYRYEREGKKHEVWFEDVRSMRAKFGLVQEYGLRGAGYWQIMRLFRPGWILSADTFRIVRGG